MNYNIDVWSINELKEIFDIEQALNSEIINKKVNEYVIKIESGYSDDEIIRLL